MLKVWAPTMFARINIVQNVHNCLYAPTMFAKITLCAKCTNEIPGSQHVLELPSSTDGHISCVVFNLNKT